MGLMDSLKKATGLGLSHAEHYNRAFEKGVLLGPGMYGEAIKLFDQAARKAAEVGDGETQARSIANARLYSFIGTGAPEHLIELRRALDAIPQIEVIGSQTEFNSTDALKVEVDGRVIEHRIRAIHDEDHQGLATVHQNAADTFRQIFQAPLVTYRFQRSDQHTETAQSRYFLHQGLSNWHLALHAVLSDPEAAAEQMGKALASFRQCQDEAWSGRAQTWLAGCRQRRTCWLCHRECQGATVHFSSYNAVVTPYVAALVTRLGQDASSIDIGSGQIVLCRTCGSSMERIADQFAAQQAGAVRAELLGQLSRVASVLDELAVRVRTLEVRSVFK